MTSTASLALQLRAVADERRLRLLRLCADGPATVSALAAALSDSEPNVSRQLKQLSEAGLLRRSRLGQFVEYSLADARDPAARTAHWLIAQLGGEDAALQAARGALRRARGVEPARPAPVNGLAPPSRFGRTLAATLSTALLADARARRVLVRSRHPELIVAMAAEAAAVALVAGSAAERAALRRWAIEQGLDLDVDLEEPLAARARAEGCDLVVLGAPVPGDAAVAGLEAGLALARRLLRSGGRSWLMADYDALEADPAGATPLQRLRGLAQAAGFDCDELLPVEAEGRHLLVARARLPATGASLARSA